MPNETGKKEKGVKIWRKDDKGRRNENYYSERKTESENVVAEFSASREKYVGKENTDQKM